MAKLESNLLRIALNAPAKAAAALRQTANDIVQIAKQLAPVDSGDLQRSYKVEPVSDAVMMVGSDIEYAPFVEFGTADQGAQPHFTVAFHQSEKTFKARLKQVAE